MRSSTFLRAVEIYARPTQPFKSNLVELSKPVLVLLSSTGHTELLGSKLSQTHSGLCENLRKCYCVCRANKDVSK